VNKKHIFATVILTYLVTDAITCARADRHYKKQRLAANELSDRVILLVDVLERDDVIVPDHVKVDALIKSAEISTKYAAKQ
jgi:hypothetical protein